MGGIFSLFGGGGKKETKAVEKPTEDKAAIAQAEARRRALSGRGFRETIIGSMANQGLKTRLGQ